MSIALPSFSGVILNGGFETDSGSGSSASWTDTSTFFGFTRCSSSCFGVGPKSGSFWSSLGGVMSDAETGTISQVVNFASGGTATLSAYIWYRSASGNDTDVFTVMVDGTTLLTIMGTDPTGTGYALNTWDVSAFANGSNHTIQFQLRQFGGRDASFNVNIDDVFLSNPGASGVPEPATFALGSTGLAAIFAVRRRK